MRILLKDERSQGSSVLDFDPDPVGPDPWKGQNDAGHQVLLKTGLRPPFNQIFLKRWKNKEAPAHELLTAICGKTLPATPVFFGIERHGKDTVYAYEFKLGYDTLDNYLKVSSNIATLVTQSLLQQISKAAIDCFEALEPRQYIYIDFNTKNMLYNQNGGIVLIDLDSAWSVPQLIKRWNDPLQTGNFDRRFWLMWYFYFAKNMNIDRAAQLLPKTMVLSFAAMYCRALGYLNQLNSPFDEVALELVRQPDKDIQKEFWNALQAGDARRFHECLHIKPADNLLFEEWRELFNELMTGRFVAWREIRQVTTDLAAYYPAQIKPAQKKAPPNPARQHPIMDTLMSVMWDVAEGLLHGLIDPFWIMRRSGRLKRRSPYQ